MNQFIRKCEYLPVCAIATAAGLTTLANAYMAVASFTGIRHMTMIAAVFVWVAAAIKMTVHFQTFKREYTKVISGSLYATFTMLTMVLGSYFFAFHEGLGRFIWLTGIILHPIHILIFTYLNVIKGINKETFLPTWFITYVGLLCSAVAGVPMGMPQLLIGIVYYGFGIVAILLPCILYRLIKDPLPEQHHLKEVILLAPSSLCLIEYLNVSADPIPIIVYSWYLINFLTLI